MARSYSSLPTVSVLTLPGRFSCLSVRLIEATTSLNVGATAGAGVLAFSQVILNTQAPISPATIARVRANTVLAPIWAARAGRVEVCRGKVHLPRVTWGLSAA